MLAAKKIFAYIPDNPNIYETEILDMTSKLGDKISSYSHGMKQKLVIIGALIHSPKLLVLDEPFVGLDPEASFKIKNIFKELTEEGTAIFFSTHVLETAEKICNKVAVIRHGEVIKCGEMSVIKKDESLEDVFMELLGEGDGKNI